MSLPGDRTSAHILVVDDETDILELAQRTLRLAGFTVSTAANGAEALRLASEESPNVVILDGMLPDIDGLDVCASLRDQIHPPAVLFLSARSSSADKVQALMLGGDDYLTKPFDLDELVARVHTLVRRSTLLPSTVVRVGNLELDDAARTVKMGAKSVRLTPTEYSLLRHLAANRDKIVSKSELYSQVWRYDYENSNGAVETYIAYLRKKLRRLGPDPIETVRGAGYRLSTPRS